MEYKHSQKKKKMKTLTVILLAVGVFLVAFIVSMIVIFCVKGSVPDVLIQCVLGAGGVEALLCAAIQIVNTIIEKTLDKRKEEEMEGEG